MQSSVQRMQHRSTTGHRRASTWCWRWTNLPRRSVFSISGGEGTITMPFQETLWAVNCEKVAER